MRKSKIIITTSFLFLTVFCIAQVKESVMNEKATGKFEVNLAPLEQYNTAEEAKLGRMSIDKYFFGELEAISKGEMLTAFTDVKGSAGYVAVERVTGMLKGKKGSFTLQHSGIMNRGEQNLTLSVVPDSGTDELLGLEGNMKINIADGKHFYEFDYRFNISR